MPAVSVQCPHCSHSYSVDGSLVGRKARCKNCGNSFALAPSGELARPSPASSADPTSAPGPSTSPSTIPLPEKVGRFVIKQRLGAGACGAVYRALDPTLDRDVALKVPHRELQQDPRALERFLIEAKAAAKLQHPHIVPVYEAGTDGDSSYIASAFIAGRSLADAIDGVPFEPRRAARIVAALADALHAAHQQGIVHRDVKPANVLLDAEDRPHLTDFGLARLAAASAKLTQVNAIVGTPAYLAPEQARGQSNMADAASDQYSLGVTLYELLCGEVPFAGPLEVVIFHTLQTPPPPLRAEHPDVPADLETICLKALAKKAEDRFASCRELAQELGKWLTGRPITWQVPTQPATELLEVSASANARGTMAFGAASLPPTVVDQNSQGDPRSLTTAEPTGRGGRRLPSRPWSIAAKLSAVIVPLMAAVIYVTTRPNEATIERNDPPAPRSPAPQAEIPIKPLANTAKTSNGSTPPAAAVLTQLVPPVATVSGAPLTTANSAAPAVASKPDVRPDPISSAADRGSGHVGASTPNERQPSRGLAYHEQIAEVQRALAAKDVAAASRVLASCPVESRGWEWHYCQRLCDLNVKQRAATGASPGSPGSQVVNQQVVTINEPQGPLTNVAFSPDGTRVATTSGVRRGPLKIWDARSGTALKEKVVCDVASWALAFSPDGKFIATGSVDAVVRIWDATNLKLLHAEPLHASRVVRKKIIDWNSASVRAVGGIQSVAFSPDGRSTASAGNDGTVRIWNFNDEADPPGDRPSIKGGAASSPYPGDEKGPSDERTRRPDKSKFRTLLREQGDVVCDVVWDPGGRWIASGGAGKINLWNLKKGGEPSKIDFLAQCLAVNPDGRRIAAASIDHDPTASVWDVETGKTVMTLSGKKAIAYLDFSPDGKRLATAGRWNVQIWDATTGHQLLELGEPRNDDPNDKVFSTAVRFSPDGRRIASVRGDLLRIWSIPEATATAAGPGIAGPVDDRSGANTKQTPDPTNQTPTPVAPGFITTQIGSITLRRIPAGEFLMGAAGEQSDSSPDQKPQHRVRISRPFYLGLYEVTQAQYRAATGANPSWFSAAGGGKKLITDLSTDPFPVENVSWSDAVRFCNTLSEREGVKPYYGIDGAKVWVPDPGGIGYRLPTEAEWEYACRAGTRTLYAFGDGSSRLEGWADKAWIMINSGRELHFDLDLWLRLGGDWRKFDEELERRGCRTHPVGEKPPNDNGLYDLAGNVLEWCWDYHGNDYYARSPQFDPAGPDAGANRIVRGGSYQCSPFQMRSAHRVGSPDSPHKNVGFRLARTVP